MIVGYVFHARTEGGVELVKGEVLWNARISRGFANGEGC